MKRHFMEAVLGLFLDTLWNYGMPSDPWTRHFLEAHVGNGRVPLGDLVGHFKEKLHSH